MEQLPFDSLYRHGFARVAVAVPKVRVADPAYNVEHTLGLARRAAEVAGKSAESIDDLKLLFNQ